MGILDDIRKAKEQSAQTVQSEQSKQTETEWINTSDIPPHILKAVIQSPEGSVMGEMSFRLKVSSSERDYILYRWVKENEDKLREGS